LLDIQSFVLGNNGAFIKIVSKFYFDKNIRSVYSYEENAG